MPDKRQTHTDQTKPRHEFKFWSQAYSQKGEQDEDDAEGLVEREHRRHWVADHGHAKKTRLLGDGQIVQKMRHQNRYLSGQPENMLEP